MENTMEINQQLRLKALEFAGKECVNEDGIFTTPIPPVRLEIAKHYYEFLKGDN